MTHRRVSTTVAATRGEDKSSDESAKKKAAATERELREARVRAERMAVRLKLRGVVAGPGSVGVKPNAMPKIKSLDAHIIAETSNEANGPSATPGFAPGSSARAETQTTTSSTRFIEDERSAVRSRLEKYSMNRYAFVVRGERKGRVVDRVTGADVSDDASDDTLSRDALSAQDKLDLARERVKQAEQEAANARDAELAAAAAAARRVEEAVRVLESRRATLADLARAEAERLATRAESDDNAPLDVDARRAMRAALDAMDVADGAARAGGAGAGAGAKKSATRSGDLIPSDDASESSGSSESDLGSGPDAKTRAADAIRARASSSLSRLRKQRRIKRAGSARRSTSRSVTNSSVNQDFVAGESSSDRAAAKTSSSSSSSSSTRADADQSSTTVDLGMDVLPKPIFVLSDCTGESAANTCRAALTQFAEVMNLSAPTNLYVFRFLSEGSDAYKICEQAREDDALVVYTLSDAALATAVATACKVFGVKAVNLWGPLLVAMEEHLAMQRTGVPMSDLDAITRDNATTRSTNKRTMMHGDADVLSTDYYRMIEAVEFTRRMDDGARPERWRDADILILGVSRTGKTPLSIYLGQRGYKVANLPLVPRDGQLLVPKHIENVDPKRVFGLLIDGEVLHSIRANRLNTIGVGARDAGAREYAAARVVTQELALAKALYARNPEWQVLDVTHKGVEETAARIMKLMYRNEDANNYRRMRAT